MPFGIPVAEPPPRPRALRGVVDGIGERDRVLVWPGGIWEWFDPLTVIRAVATLRPSHPDLRLVFMGLGHPNPHIERMAMTTRAVALADELALRDSVVFFNFGWVPYDDRGAFLRECDLAVSAHFDDVETRFALRTRLLDCVWAGLPVVTTRGDAVGDLLAERGVARTVPAESVDAWRAALTALLGDPEARAAAASAADRLRADLVWPRVVDRLAAVLDRVEKQPHRDARLTAAAARHLWVRLRLSALHRGTATAVARAAGLSARRVGGATASRFRR